MPPRLRTTALAVHLAVSVGWMGALAAYLSLDVTASTGTDPAAVRAAYRSMDAVVRSVIVPLALATVVTGLAVSLGTRWGLFRHYWVLVSFVLTIAATGVLLLEAGTVRELAARAGASSTPHRAVLGLPGTLAHSVGGLVVLSVILVLNVFKPAGLTPYGWRKQREAGQGRV